MKNFMFVFSVALLLTSCASAPKPAIPEVAYDFCHNYELMVLTDKPEHITRILVDNPDQVITSVMGQNVLIVKPNRDLDETEKKDRPSKVRLYTSRDKAQRVLVFKETDCKTSKTIHVSEE
jgi:hypothetical protein